MKRTAKAVWAGDLKSGKGRFGLSSGALSDQPYSFKTRFENEDGKAGTNPEELIAAAHASCFAMQLSAFIAERGFVADRLEVEAVVTLVPGTGITGSHLVLVGTVPGMAEADFVAEAERAKQNCPVSKALAAIDVTLEVSLAG
ncbi:MAG: OsmC family protein [Alphaproteobacteria bacterium]|nr:OsmC family protein [Alphaproteobacteria bacterium]